MQTTMYNNLKTLCHKLIRFEMFNTDDYQYLCDILNDKILLRHAERIVYQLDNNPFSTVVEKDIVNMISALGNNTRDYAGYFILPSHDIHATSHNINPELYQKNAIKFFEDIKRYFSKFNNLEHSFMEKMKQDSHLIKKVYDCVMASDNQTYFQYVKNSPLNNIIDYLFLIIYRNNAIQNIALYNKQDINEEYDELFDSLYYIINGLIKTYINEENHEQFSYFFTMDNNVWFIPNGPSELVVPETIIEGMNTFSAPSEYISPNSKDEMLDISEDNFDIMVIYLIVKLCRYYHDLILYGDKFTQANKFLIPIRNCHNFYNIFIEDKYVKKLVKVFKTNNQFEAHFKSKQFSEIFRHCCIENPENKSINILKLL